MRVMRRLGLAVLISSAALLPTSCASEPLASPPHHTTSDGADGPKSAQGSSASTPVDIKGVGPQTITVPVPGEKPKHFESAFKCESGSYTVVLQEDTGVFESGNKCAEGFGFYQMPIPGVSELHFVITVDPASTFEFKGDFD